jgi:hypothetical protein
VVNMRECRSWQCLVICGRPSVSYQWTRLGLPSVRDSLHLNLCGNLRMAERTSHSRSNSQMQSAAALTQDTFGMPSCVSRVPMTAVALLLTIFSSFSIRNQEKRPSGCAVLWRPLPWSRWSLQDSF